MPVTVPEESSLHAPLLVAEGRDGANSSNVVALDNNTSGSRLWRTLSEYCRSRVSRCTEDSAVRDTLVLQVPPGQVAHAPSPTRRVLKQQASDPTDYLYAAGMRGIDGQDSSFTRAESPPAPNEFRRHFLALTQEDISPASSSDKQSSRLLDFVIDVSYDVQEHYWRMAQSAKPSLSGAELRNAWMDRAPPNASLAPPTPSMQAKKWRQSSDLATVLVILKSFLGGTLLVAPAEFLTAGLVSGNILFVVMGFLELWCMLKLLQAYRQVGGASFGQLANAAVGPAGAIAVEVSIVASQIGFIATEMIYVARNGAPALRWLLQQVLPGLVDASWGQDDFAAALTWLQLLLVVPIAWHRELAALTTFNFVGNLLVLGTTVVLAVMAVNGLASQGLAEDLELICAPRRALVFLGFSVFTFEGINMVIPMYESHRDKASFDRLLVGTIVAVISIFLIFSSGNVLLYGQDLQPILTLNLPQDSVAATWVPVAFALASLALVPLLALPTFEVIESGLARPGQCGKALVASHARVNAFRAALLTLCAVMARFGGKHLDDFLSVVGAVACVPLALIYPATIHLRLVANTATEVVGDWICIVAGIGVTVLCTVEVFCPLT